MAVALNGVGERHARALIEAGRVNKTSDWSMSATEEDAILGANDWAAYSSWHLGVDTSAKNDTKAHYKYPFGKGGKVYRAALVAIRQRSAQQDATSIFEAAGKLLEAIDGNSRKNCLKAISQTDEELRVANYMVLFGGRDLIGEFFTKNTDFGSPYMDTGVMYVDFEHGLDPDRVGLNAHEVLGYVDWKSAKIDENGIFVERVLKRQNEYMKFIEKLINAGLLGTSSQAIHGKTVKKSSGEIVEWPLQRDSLTATPMDPRMIDDNVLSTAKALYRAFPNSKSLAQLVGERVVLPAGIEDITDFKSAEHLLRDAGGFSRSEATAFIARLKGLVQSESAANDEIERVLAAACRDMAVLKSSSVEYQSILEKK